MFLQRSHLELQVFHCFQQSSILSCLSVLHLLLSLLLCLHFGPMICLEMIKFLLKSLLPRNGSLRGQSQNAGCVVI
jgi:hypothetical protein